MYIKVVPDKEPNADGVWIEVPDISRRSSFGEMLLACIEHKPKDHHIVQYTFDVANTVVKETDNG